MKNFLKININNTFFALILLLLISVSTFELHYLLYFLVIVIFYSKISKDLLNVAFLLTIILFSAILSSFFNDFKAYDWIKDFTYFSRPLLAVFAGYFISKKINNFVIILRSIVVVSLIYAIYHISKVLILIDFSIASVSDIRNIGGLSNEIEILALIILISENRLKNVVVFENKFYKKIVVFILSTSFVLYASRTMLLSLIIFYLASFGYLKLTRKSLKYGMLLLTFFILFYVYLFNANIQRGKSGIESFLYKMKIAPAEIFSPSKSINVKDHAQLWDHWRAYEATMALSQINSATDVFLGKGLGGLVDLKFAAPLGEKNMRYIPTLHNGYVNILFKSGAIGLLSFIALLVLLYLFCYKKEKKPNKLFFYNLLSGLSVHFLMTTLIVTGLYNITEPYVFIMGVFLFFIISKENKLLLK